MPLLQTAQGTAAPQPIHPGSYVHIDKPIDAKNASVSISSWVRPFRVDGPRQAIVAIWLNGQLVGEHVVDGENGAGSLAADAPLRLGAALSKTCSTISACGRNNRHAKNETCGKRGGFSMPRNGLCFNYRFLMPQLMARATAFMMSYIVVLEPMTPRKRPP